MIKLILIRLSVKGSDIRDFIAIKKTNKNAPKKIDQYSLDGKFIKTWNSGIELSKCGFHHGNICNCCNGQRKTYKGYIWKYHE